MMNKLNPYLVTMLSLFGGFKTPEEAENEVDKYLRINNRTLEEEYNLIKQKKSSLSVRLRNEIEWRYERLRKEIT